MMPFVGHFTGGMDFADLAYELSPAVMENGEVVKAANSIKYGKWLNSVIGLITTGFVLFMMVKSYNKTKFEGIFYLPASQRESDWEVNNE